MDFEETEIFLKKLGLERYIDLFKKNEIDLELLIDLSEDELEKMLKDMNLPIGPKTKILKGVQSLNVKGKYQL